MDSESFFLPEVVPDSQNPFQCKIFKILFFIPGIIFNVERNDPTFPDNVTAKYRTEIFSDTTAGLIVCLTDATKTLEIKFVIHNKNKSCWRIETKNKIIGKTSRLFFPHHINKVDASYIDGHALFPYHDRYMYETIIPDDNIMSENIYTIAEYFLGPNSRKVIDSRIHTIQKHLFIKKFLNTYLLIGAIECFFIVKYLLIHFLLIDEDDEDNSHIIDLID